MRNAPEIGGYADAPFAPVRDAFRENFEHAGELGAAFSLYRHGRKVVDLWGGVRDPASRAPFGEDTWVPVFSAGKGIAAIACAVAVSQSHFGYDDVVAAHWPAFRDNGKAAITVRDLLAHAGGLALFGRPIRRADLADPERFRAILDDIKPVWQPNASWGYHIATFGPLVAELIRRTDPRGRSFARFFAEEVAERAGVAFHFGLPDNTPPDRVARVAPPKAGQVLQAVIDAPLGLRLHALDPFSLLHRAFREVPHVDVNDPQWLAFEFPSSNGVGEVRALAKLYGLLATGGSALGLRLDVMEALVGEPRLPAWGSRDRVMGMEGLWHLGFTRPTADFPFSASPRAFGMPGVGGSFAFCDPDQGLGYAYAPTRLGLLPFDDARERRLRKAVYGCLAALEGEGAAAEEAAESLAVARA